MNNKDLLQEIFFNELEGYFRVVTKDREGGIVIRNHEQFDNLNRLNLVYVGFGFTGEKVFVNCQLILNRRYQECYELVDPKSIEKIIDLVRRHFDGEIDTSLYT